MNYFLAYFYISNHMKMDTENLTRNDEYELKFMLSWRNLIENSLSKLVLVLSYTLPIALRCAGYC